MYLYIVVTNQLFVKTPFYLNCLQNKILLIVKIVCIQWGCVFIIKTKSLLIHAILIYRVIRLWLRRCNADMSDMYRVVTNQSCLTIQSTSLLQILFKNVDQNIIFPWSPIKAFEPHGRLCEYCDDVNFQTLGAFLEMFSLEWEVTLENNYLLHFNTGAQMAQWVRSLDLQCNSSYKPITNTV